MARSINPTPGTPKPMQRGTVSWNYGSQDVTVAPVDWSKAKLQLVGSGIANMSGNAPNVFAEPINATTVRFTHQVSGSQVTVKYQIEEWH